MANEIHIGDVGTVYRLPTYDNDLALANFDPTAAPIKQLIFRMPAVDGGFVMLTRDATAAQWTIDGVDVWGLEYTTLAADVVAYVSASVGGFHQAAGTVKLEGYVEFSSAQKWASSTVSRDQEGRVLKVKARLSA